MQFGIKNKLSRQTQTQPPISTMSLAAFTSSLSCRKAFAGSPRRHQAAARGRLQVQAFKVGAPQHDAARFSIMPPFMLPSPPAD